MELITDVIPCHLCKGTGYAIVSYVDTMKVKITTYLIGHKIDEPCSWCWSGLRVGTREKTQTDDTALVAKRVQEFLLKINTP